MTKILITDSYSQNTGDVGILMAMVQQLKQISDLDLAIEASSPDNLQHFDIFDDIKIYPRIFNISGLSEKSNWVSRISIYITGLFDTFIFFVWAIFTRLRIPAIWLVRPSRQEQAAEYQNTDIFISAGGGFLSSYYTWQFRVQVYLVALILRKKIMIFAQSVGPFNSIISRFIMKKVLNKVDIITIREPNSFEYLSSFNLDKPYHITADIAFLLDVNELKPKKNGSVAICVKAHPDKHKLKKYQKNIIKISQYIIKHGSKIKIVSQTPADDELCQYIVDKIGGKSEAILFGSDPRDIKGIYGMADFVIANRMHTIVFATETSTPFIAISYEPKFDGLMSQLEYPDELLLGDTFSFDELQESVEYIMKHLEKLRYKLNDKMPEIKKHAHMNVSHLLSIL